MTQRCGAVLALLLPLAAPAVGQTTAITDPAPLAPSGKWLIDRDDNGCTLERDYGTGAGLVTFGFRPSPLNDGLELVIVAAGSGTAYHRGTAQVILQPTGRLVAAEAETFALEGKPQTVAKIFANPDASIGIDADLKGATSIIVKFTGGKRIAVAVPHIAGAYTALQTCQANVLRGWGVDPAERTRIAQPPISASPASWIGSGDYPSKALRRRAQGTSTLLWAVGIDGRVSDCRTVISSGNADLDAAACYAIRRRGRYRPAVGQDGKPMVVHQMRRVVWRVP